MRGAFDEGLIRYYNAELAALRRTGLEFARTHPKIAARLELGPDECPDPHVERLLESFAFLTARIHHKIDADFPEIPAALLEVLYPSLVQPIPPATILRFGVTAENPPPPAGITVARGASFTAQAESGPACRFRTTSALRLQPVEVLEVALRPPAAYDFLDTTEIAAVLAIRIGGLGVELSAVDGLADLTFHLAGDPLTTRTIYEALSASLRSVILDGGAAGRVTLPSEALSPRGMDDDEALLPDPPTAHPGYRLLQEYFAFPEKFLFFRLDGLRRRPRASEVEILLCLDEMPAGLAVDESNFLLHCVPAINLFPKSAEPIRLDHLRSEHPVHPDIRREASTEIHSIIDVSLSARDDRPAERLSPYFSFDHLNGASRTAHWIARRQPTGRANLPGTEMVLRFVDLELNPARPPAETLYVRTLATNRTLAEQVPAGAQLTPDEPVPVRAVTCLRRPTATLYPSLEGATLWKLVSSLSLNHLSLEGGRAGVEALREMLTLYCPSTQPATRHQIAGLTGLTTRPVVRRIGIDAWRGFVHGTSIDIELDSRAFVGGSALMFGAVLSRFFTLYAAVNSFVEVSVSTTQRQGIWKQWPPTVGDTALI
jgi:type VI secretion system protein ImpG